MSVCGTLQNRIVFEFFGNCFMDGLSEKSVGSSDAQALLSDDRVRAAGLWAEAFADLRAQWITRGGWMRSVVGGREAVDE